MSQPESSEILNAFALTLKSIRQRRNLNQEEMAEFLGVSSGQLANWETARNLAPMDTTAMLADKLEVTIDYLIGRVSGSGTATEVLREPQTSADIIVGEFIVKEMRYDERGNSVLRAKSKNRAVEIVMGMPLTLGSAIRLTEIHEPTRSYPAHQASSKAAAAAEEALKDLVAEPDRPDLKSRH